jgi:hypothetical protein
MERNQTHRIEPGEAVDELLVGCVPRTVGFYGAQGAPYVSSPINFNVPVLMRGVQRVILSNE